MTVLADSYIRITFKVAKSNQVLSSFEGVLDELLSRAKKLPIHATLKYIRKEMQNLESSHEITEWFQLLKQSSVSNQELYQRIKQTTKDKKQYLCCHAEIITQPARFPIALQLFLERLNELNQTLQRTETKGGLIKINQLIDENTFLLSSILSASSNIIPTVDFQLLVLILTYFDNIFTTHFALLDKFNQKHSKQVVSTNLLEKIVSLLVTIFLRLLEDKRNNIPHANRNTLL